MKKIIRQICITNENEIHDKPSMYSFDKIVIEGKEEIKSIWIKVILPNLGSEHSLINGYEFNMIKSLKIVGNTNFSFDQSDMYHIIREYGIPECSDGVLLPIMPHNKFKFPYDEFENAYTEVVLRPMKLLYIGSVLRFRPEVQLIVEIKE